MPSLPSTGSNPQSQEDLVSLIDSELYNNPLQFTPATISRMLSPKELSQKWTDAHPFPPPSSDAPIPAMDVLSVKSDTTTEEEEGENLGSAKTEPTSQEHGLKLEKLRDELHLELKYLGDFKTCVAILGDFDLSTKLEDYFTRNRSLAQSLSVSQNMPVPWILLMEVAGHRGIHVYGFTGCNAQLQ